MTAVSWLEQEFIKLESTIGVHGKMYELIEQAKEMEKQQIIDAYKFGLSDEYVIGSDNYYTSTYGSKGSDDHIVDTNEMIEDTYKVWECCGMEECICKGSDETKTDKL